MTIVDSLSSLAPWQRVLDRLQCLHEDPACRSSVAIHATLLAAVFFLACFSKLLKPQSSSESTAPSRPPRTSRAEVHSIIVYPIKSCAGVKLDSAYIGRKGLELDRRWMVIAEGKDGKWVKKSLREEPRLTLILPSIEEHALRLSISELAERGEDDPLPPIRIPLTISEEWQTVPAVEMWGDCADGRVPELADPEKAEWQSGPSEWISQFLGYSVLLIQFDFQGPSRNAFPFYKAPELSKGDELQQLRQPQGIEFQDEYPLLIATVESLEALQAQIRDAALASDDSDGRGGPRIGGKLFQQESWRKKINASSDAARLGTGSPPDDGQDGVDTAAEWFSMLRFRPNIVLQSSKEAGATRLEAWEEDQWTSIDFSPHQEQAAPEEQGQPATCTVKLHLVARCERCLLTTVDPQTAERDVSVPLAFLRRSRNQVKKVALDEDGMPIPAGAQSANAKQPRGTKSSRPGPCFGIYAVVPSNGMGRLAIGDAADCIWSAQPPPP